MRFRCLAAPLAAAILAFASVLPVQAALLIEINKSTQRMSVLLDGAEIFNWPVSTGIRSYETPSGDFKPFRMEKDHFSREWDDAPMPHSIFFTQTGHAIHGTNHVKAIGTPASHGCVRLEPANARTLFDLVKQEKMANTRVVLRGETPEKAPPAVARRDRDQTQSREYARRYDSQEFDDDFTDAMPPPPARKPVARDSGWRQYSDGQRYYYYREPQYVPPPRRQYYGYQPYPYYPYGR